jgi:hypothetical protein
MTIQPTLPTCGSQPSGGVPRRRLKARLPIVVGEVLAPAGRRSRYMLVVDCPGCPGTHHFYSQIVPAGLIRRRCRGGAYHVTPRVRRRRVRRAA